MRILIITYYWPPAGGPGVQRWLKFVKYFPDFGIEPVVFVPENPSYPIIDAKLKDEVPSGLEIIKFPIKEPYSLAKLISKGKVQKMSSGMISGKKSSIIEKILLYVRGNYFIPDARIGWVKPSVAFLDDFLRTNQIDALITTGPPHSVHLIGLHLKQQLGIKWIADFRDPWTTIHYHKSLRLNKISQRKHELMESEVLNNADVITVTSHTTKKEFNLLTQKPIEVITNGYDTYEQTVVGLDQKFSISHIGSLLNERNPQILWSTLREICESNKAFAEDLELKFAGKVGEEVKNSLKSFQLLDVSRFLGYVSHEAAIQLQRKSQVLLLIEINSADTRAIIPGKIFEYITSHRPILSIGPKGSEIAEILSDTNTGWFCDYTERDKLKDLILRSYEDYRAGSLRVDPQNLHKYSRRELTKKMAAVLHQ